MSVQIGSSVVNHQRLTAIEKKTSNGSGEYITKEIHRQIEEAANKIDEQNSREMEYLRKRVHDYGDKLITLDGQLDYWMDRVKHLEAKINPRS